MKINLISVNGGIDVNDSMYMEMTEDEKIKNIVDQLLLFAGRLGGECYSSESLKQIQNESEETTRKRVNFCIKKMHHSLFDHPTLTFEFEGISKFVFMILNNQYVYTTSERSARYTNFYELIETEQEQKLYTKWEQKLIEAITEVYGDKFTPAEKQKLAQENARYMISVFVPSSMIHTISLRQLNYVMFYMEEFLSSDWEKEKTINREFMKILRPRLEEFLTAMSIYKVEGLIPKAPASLAIFQPVLDKKNIADASYRLNYFISFAGFAQDHRHRSIRYSIELTDANLVYIPDIIKATGLEDEWKKDMMLVSRNFPQGMLIEVTENGEIEDYVKKCYERSCGRAQKEIQEVANQGLTFLRTTQNVKVKKYLEDTTGTSFSRCTFPGYVCSETCKFGAKQRERKI